LACGEWVLKGEAEQLSQEAHLFIAMRKPLRDEL
jgi:hypothetical protein